MAEFRLTAAAARDLDDIFDYGAGQWGADQAASYIATLAERFALLADFPEIGPASRRYRTGCQVDTVPKPYCLFQQ